MKRKKTKNKAVSRAEISGKVHAKLVAGKSSKPHGLHKVKSKLVHPEELDKPGVLMLISPKKPLKFISNAKKLEKKGHVRRSIHFSQESVSGKVTSQMGDKVPFIKFCEEFKKTGWITDEETGQLINPIDVVYNDEDGRYITLDHRRLVAAKISEVQRVFVRIHQWEESLPDTFVRRFKGSRTWGQAVMCRLDGQRTMRTPSPELPHINGITYSERRDLGLIAPSAIITPGRLPNAGHTRRSLPAMVN